MNDFFDHASQHDPNYHEPYDFEDREPEPVSHHIEIRMILDKDISEDEIRLYIDFILDQMGGGEIESIHIKD